jgi:hypothetical protein
VHQNSLSFETFDLEDTFRHMLVQTLKPYDRGWFAEQIEKLALRKCSEEIIDRWASDRNAPAFLVPTICEISQKPDLYHFLGKPIQSLLNKDRLESLAQAHEERARWDRRIAELENRI